jgi:predicted RNase H-like HicB family nuclease
MSLPHLQSGSPTDIELTLVLTQQASGTVTASALEIPNCQVEAETREMAIANLKILLAQLLETFEIVPVRIPLSHSLPVSNPWSDLAGVLKDSQYFDEVMEIIQSEREKLGDADIDSSFYMPKSSD